MAALSQQPMMPFNAENSRVAALWKRLTGKGHVQPSPPSPISEPPLSRASSPGSGLIRRVSRRVVPGLPRAKTFKRQISEEREKLALNLPTPSERRGASADRRLHSQRDSSCASQPLPQASVPDFLNSMEQPLDQSNIFTHSVSAPQSPTNQIQTLSLNEVGAISVNGYDDDEDEPAPTEHEMPTTGDAQSSTTSRYDAIIHEELERKWILNLSMHFRDKSRREKFFVTYRETAALWRRVTISLDYRDAPDESLEQDLLNTKLQRDKSAKIYEAIRESLQDIQFYETVTNLKLQTSDGRLHVHVVEDVNEIVHFPSVRMVQHMRSCPRVRESELEFDSHMSGFVYKVRVDGKTLIKKEIPGPDTVDEFLYEVNALHSLRYSKSIIEFYGVVVDDEDQSVKGLLISYADKGALIDVIYDSSERGDQDLPWHVREKWARQIVQGLSDIHETGFVQGDFTLSNIVIDDHGNAKIIDINRRGCPVGWEPPEATPLIDSNQRISMYIGVKSDLYQLGMVLWALATLEDEPEAHPRPLRLHAELGVPTWYRRIVETCLHEKPQARLQASALLTLFPQIPYEEAREEGLPFISVQEDDTYAAYAVDDRYGVPQVRTVEPRSSWPYSSASNASPSFSDGRYPSRGRSPPSPSTPNCGLYRLPSNSRDAAEMKARSATVAGEGFEVNEESVVTPKGLDDLQDSTPLLAREMADELDQMAADEQAEAGLKHEPTRLSGGDSQADGPSLDLDLDSDSGSIYLGPTPEPIAQDEGVSMLNDDWLKITSPTQNRQPGDDSRTTATSNAPVPGDDSITTSAEAGEKKDSVEIADQAAEEGTGQELDADEDNAGRAGENDATPNGEETTTTVLSETKTEAHDLDETTAHDRTDAATEGMPTPTTEATETTKTDLTAQNDSPLPADSPEPDVATTEAAEKVEATA